MFLGFPVVQGVLVTYDRKPIWEETPKIASIALSLSLSVFD
jgi:hypothetical protein